MSLAYPSFLFFISLISLPIILHLWSIKRAKQEFFSNVSLLKQLNIISNKTSKIKHLLLLLARIGFVIFLTVAFAKLYPTKSPFNAMKSNLDIKVDNSCSVMASKEAWNKINRLYAGLSAKGTEEPLPNQEIPSDCNLNTFSLSDYLKNGVQNATVQNVIVSDFQKSFVDVDEIKKPSNILYLVPLNSQNLHPNVSIDSVWLTETYLKRKGRSNEIIVRLSNAGERKAENIVVELRVEKSTIASQSVSIEAKSKLNIRFQIVSEEKRNLLCKLTINDGSWAFDNIFDFVLTRTEQLPILLITDQIQNNPIKTAYDQEEEFKCQIVKEEMGGSSLSRASLMVIDKQDNLDKTFLGHVFEQVRKGSSLALFTSEKWEKDVFDFINTEMGKAVAEKAINPGTSVELEPPDIKNPFLSNMFENALQGTHLPSIFLSCALKAPNSAILKTKAGNIALGEYWIGKGKVFIFSFGLGQRETFSRNAIFLPILFRIAERSVRNSLPPYLRIGDKFLEFQCDSCSEKALYSVQNDYAKIIPEQKAISNGVQLYIQDKLATGYWKVCDKQGKEITSFGLNPNKRESEMDFYSIEELKEKFEKEGQVKVVPYEEFTEKIMGLGRSKESPKFWRYVVAISFLFLLAEIAIARYFKKKQTIPSL